MKTSNDCARGKYLLPLMTIILWMAGTMSLHAKDYGFWVGSVKVTSSNYNDIKGGNIESGTVKYDPNTNILTLTNVHINAKGSGGDVIHNESCYGLKVHFYGTNNLYAHNDVAVWCETQSEFIVKTGFTRISGYDANKQCFYLMGAHPYRICSEIGAEFWIEAKGYGILGYPPKNSTTYPDLDIGGDNIYINADKGSLRNLHEVEFWSYGGICDVTMQSTGNSSFPIVSYVLSMPDVNYSSASKGDPIIVSPFKAEYLSTKAGICDSSGNFIYADNIYVSNEYVVPINSRYFSNTAFRNYLMNRFGYVVLWQSTINNCTSMDVSGLGISSLDGINYFTELQTLYCNNNDLNYLSNVSLGKLTYLDCRNNQLTQLGYTCNRLEKLYCGNNQLTSISVSDMGNMKQLYCSDNYLKTINFKNTGLTDLYCSNNKLTTLNDFSSVSSTLQYLYCENNSFTSLQVSSFSKLKDFRCSNNPSLQTLSCSYNTALTSLSVSNCASLKTMTCSGNSNMTSLGLSSVPSLETLTCTNNGRMSSISLYCDNLKTVNVSNNALTTLNLWDTNVYDLNCSNNQLTSIVLPPSISKINCSNNKFTTFTWAGYLTNFDISNNSYLTSLIIPGNSNLSDISIGGCNALKILDISGCGFSSIYLSNRTALEELYCQNQTNHKLTSLSVNGCSALKKLSCGQNQLSSLNLTGCKALTEIDCSINQLTSITLPSSCPSLQSISCQANRISGNAMDALVAALPNRANSTAGAFKVLYTGTYYEEGNVCLTTHVDKARAKNWNTYQTSSGNNWTLYAGGVPTDISTIEADNDDDAQRYNTSGQRVGRDYKGVIIVNGKKKVVK